MKKERKEKWAEIRAEFDKVGDCVVMPINDATTKKLSRIELMILDGDKHAHRGWNLMKYTEKGVNKVHNSDLYEFMKDDILANVFVMDKETGKQLLNDTYSYERKDLNVKFHIKKSKKKIKFIFNTETIFTLRLVKTETGYEITPKAYWKCQDVVQKRLEDIFLTTVEDFNKFKKLISLIDEYLFLT